MPGLKDAYISYQKGAAIAIPPPITPNKFDNPDDLTDFDEEGEEDGEYIDTGVRRGPPGYILPGTYIRPEYARIHREDEKEDWRDPPVDVVEPHWGETREDKANVTWLGHASVLVRLPWKTEGRKGMCGVLFDPIFSTR
jgi:N-acyl-phosphatidylethanolamine-hydrolysing phospholipase D